MKTIIKNKWNYRRKIGRLGNDNQDLPATDQANSSRSQQAAGGVSSISNGDDGASDGEGGFSNSDENGESSNAEEEGTSAGSAGTKRKATGSGGKGKHRKI